MRSRAGALAAVLCASLAALAFAGPAAAKPADTRAKSTRAGTIDRSFSGDGKLTGLAPEVEVSQDPFQREQVDLALGPRGEVAVARGATLAEYLHDGRRRRNFGSGGRVTLYSPPGQLFKLAKIAIDSKGRVLVAGIVHPVPWQGMPSPNHSVVSGPLPSRIAVMRYTSSGQLDARFGQGGVFTSDLGLPYPEGSGSFGDPAYTYPEPSLGLSGLAVDLRDRPLLTGTTTAKRGPCYGGECSVFSSFVARVTAAGALDPTFASTGVVSDTYEEASEPLVSPRGSVFYVSTTRGNERGGPTATTVVTARLPSGAPDPKWGARDLEQEGYVGGAMIALDRQGRLTAAQSDGSSTELELVRFLAGNRPDPSFGNHGKTIVTDARLTSISSLAIDRRDRAVLLGQNDPLEPGPAIALGRRRSDGASDLGFGRRGVASARFAGSAVMADAVAVDDKGRILVAGTLQHKGDQKPTEFALVRFLGG